MASNLSVRTASGPRCNAGLRIARNGPTPQVPPPHPRTPARTRPLVRRRSCSNVELAARVRLSPSTCLRLRRVRRLEEAGVIAGYRAIIERRGTICESESWAAFDAE
jgi:Winged helix-turn-helix DNA-binding